MVISIDKIYIFFPRNFGNTVSNQIFDLGADIGYSSGIIS